MIQEVVEGVWWIAGQDSFLPDSHVYVIGKPGSEDFSLVDCGLMEKGAYKVDQLDKVGISPAQVKRIIMTHTHLDHIGCMAEILDAIPHAEVWIHKDEALPLERGDTSIVYGNRMFESMLRSQFPIREDAFNIKVHRKLEGGELLTLGGLDFKVVHLPGHSCGSIGLFHEDNRLLMSGDTIYADLAIGRVDLASASPAQMKQSLELVDTMNVDILLPCHNRIVNGGAAPMIHRTVEQWGPYL